MRRWILHVDMDAFFASVEQILDPSLAGRPVIVCGPAEERGVVSTASYEARRYGVRSAMPTSQAKRLCPDGVFISGHHRAYSDYSRRILAILRRYTPLVEQTSIDEAYLDVTGCENVLGGAAGPVAGSAGSGRAAVNPGGASLGAAGGVNAASDPSAFAVAIARSIKAEVKAETGLSCSVGVGPNRLVAKMATSLHKPDGLTVLDVDGFRRVFWPRPVGELYGVGPSTAAHLRAMGISTIGDVARYPLDLLVHEFGPAGGESLHASSSGIDDSPVVPPEEVAEAKSLSRETTFAEDIDDLGTLETTLLELADHVARRLRRYGLRGRTVTVKIRKADFTTMTRSRSLPTATDLAEDIYGEARQALRGVFRPSMKVRLLGVGATNLEEADAPGGLFEAGDKLRRVSQAVDRIKDRYGEGSVTRARLLEPKVEREEEPQ